VRPSTEADPIAALTRLVDELSPDACDASARWALAHCAQSIEFSLAGYPKLRSGLFRATIGKLAKRKFLGAGRMSHDIAAPVAGAPEIPATIAFADARVRLLAAIAAFRDHAGPLAPHLAYGPCTKPEYAALHLMHLEDHLRKR
jgi:hypothetical protein